MQNQCQRQMLFFLSSISLYRPSVNQASNQVPPLSALYLVVVVVNKHVRIIVKEMRNKKVEKEKSSKNHSHTLSLLGKANLSIQANTPSLFVLLMLFPSSMFFRK
jgi:hypothetical protein